MVIEDEGDATVVVLAGEDDPASLHGDLAPDLGVVAETLDIEPGVDRMERSASSAITIRLYRADRPVDECDLRHVPSLITQDENFVWIDVSQYDADDLHRVAEAVGLVRREVQLAESAWQRPRVEVHGDHFFASATVARLDPNAERVLAGELDLFVGNNFLVSTHKLPLTFGSRVVSRAAQDPGLIRLDSAFMLYIVLDQLLEYYDELEEGLRNQIEELQVQAIHGAGEDFLERLMRFKRYVFALNQVASQHRVLFETFLRPDFPYISGDEVQPYFQALHDRFARTLDALAGAREEVSAAFDMYVSHEAHRTNRIIKVLTMVSAGLLPITVIFSLFGTSFKTMPALYSQEAFAVMVVLVIVTVAGVIVAFRRQGWF